MLIDDGLLRFEDGAWRAVEDLADLTVPPTIHLLLAARLDRLDAEERSVIERGAVEGKVFHTGAVATLSPERLRPNVPIAPARARAQGADPSRPGRVRRRGCVPVPAPVDPRRRVPGDAEGAARRPSRTIRRAGSSAQRASGSTEYEEILAYHFEQAHRYGVELGPPDDHTRALGNAAARRLIRSADRASRDRGDSSSARPLLQRAADVSEGDLRARALFELSRVLFDLYDFQSSVEAAETAIAVAEENGDRVSALRARLIYVEGLGQIDPSYTLERTRSESEAALAELERLGDAAGIRQAKLAVARTNFYSGNCECLPRRRGRAYAALPQGSRSSIGERSS